MITAGWLSPAAQAAPFLASVSNFVVFGLAGGDVTINSATSISGNVGYAANVTSTTNQKVDSFTGGVFVHSTATFNYTPATFAPSGGITVGGVANTQLNQANADALAAAGIMAGLASTHASLGNVVDNQNVAVNSLGALNVIPIASLKHKEDTFTITGGANDVFVFNVAGNWDYDNSQIVLNGVNANNVFFNFLSAAAEIAIGKAGTVFQGTILAPQGSIDYHNPASFTGRIIGLDINLHSDFNIAAPFDPPPPPSVPAPGSLVLFALGLLGLLVARSRHMCATMVLVSR
ncbi:MAG: hypothetical protein SFV21_20135 [Rhodospirillaceae bacterium]|nr:hypothetical protein [Rhodospirillaceae bacterium]